MKTNNTTMGLTSQDMKTLKELLVKANNHQLLKIREYVGQEHTRRMGVFQ